MKRISPTSFWGPRVYFTDFDYKIVRFKQDIETYRKDVERRLKILLLTKNIVGCAASHMVNEFAYNIFKDNPILLTKNMVIPCLRKDLTHITDYLEEGVKGRCLLLQELGIKKDLKEEMKRFYNDHVSKVVDWDLMENTAWFKESLLKALKDKHSVVRRNLSNISPQSLDCLLSEIQSKEVLTREVVLKNISDWPTREQKTFLDFVNLIYHLSGARVINCESALPQENYIDYSLTDFFKHRTALSDTQVFLKIFFEIAFEILYRPTFPVELLDQLSFVDIYYLRKPIEESSFREKYEKLIQRCLQLVKRSETGSESVLNEIKEPLEVLEQISKTFKEVFEKELPEFLRRKHYKKTTKELWKSTLSLGLGAAGLIPYVNIGVIVFGLTKSSLEVFVNLLHSLKSKREADAYILHLKNKEKMLRQFIKKYSISEKSALLDTLDLIVNTISIRINL